MDVEWSVAAAEDDPVVVVPWCDEDAACKFVDLRADSSSVEQIPEALAWPEIGAALRLLNAESSGLWTAKCDVWELSDDEKSLDFGHVAHGIGSYIDVFLLGETLFISLGAQVAQMQRWAKSLSRLNQENARAELVLRPAQCFGTEGFATTVYVYGYGEETNDARRHWAEALADVVQTILYETLE